MTPKIKESEEQKQQRLLAKRENLSATQQYLQAQTKFYRKLRSPRVSIATGRSAAGIPLG